MVAVWVGVMVVGLIGMIVCGKMQKSNPAMQPVSIGLFIVVHQLSSSGSGAACALQVSAISRAPDRSVISHWT